MNQSRDVSAGCSMHQTRGYLPRGPDAADRGPCADRVSDEAAAGLATDESVPVAEDVAAIVNTVLQERPGIEAAAAEAIVSGLRRRSPAQDASSVYLDLNLWISLAKAGWDARTARGSSPASTFL